MEKLKFVSCEDRIEIDDALSEISLEALISLKSIALSCRDCAGCNGIVEEIEKEIERRGEN